MKRHDFFAAIAVIIGFPALLFGSPYIMGWLLQNP